MCDVLGLERNFNVVLLILVKLVNFEEVLMRIEETSVLNENCINLAVAISEKIAGRRSMASVTAIASLAELCYERNKIEEAEELLASAMTGSLDACLLITAQTIYSLLARISKLRGEKAESWILLDKLEKVAMKRGWVRLEGHCYAERIQSDIWEGDGVSATRELGRFEQYLETVNPDVIAKELDAELIN